MKTLYVWWVRYVRRDEIYAGLLEGWREQTMEEYLALVARRNSYQALWFEAWKSAGIDFLLSAPNALPAVPHGGMREGFKACGYSFLFNMVRNLILTSNLLLLPSRTARLLRRRASCYEGG